MEKLIRKILKEEILNNKVICDGCGWGWDLSKGGHDKYICHKCWYDNTPKAKSNFDQILNGFKNNFPKELQYKVDVIQDFVVDYIIKHNFTVKLLKSCTVGFAGVRTKNQIIICSPNYMTTLGDFLYTIFHEIRHEEQIRDLKMNNPLSDYDLEDFEKLSEKYWQMELDADTFAKEMLAKIVHSLKIPLEVALENFKLSDFIEKYPSRSKMVISNLRGIVNGIKEIKKSGGEYEDIQDHPIVKVHLDKLENFI